MNFLFWDGEKIDKTNPSALVPDLAPPGTHPTPLALSQDRQAKWEQLVSRLGCALPREFHTREEGLLDLLLGWEFYSRDGRWLPLEEVEARLDLVMQDRDGHPCLRFQEGRDLFDLINNHMGQIQTTADWERLELKFHKVQHVLLNFLQHPVTRGFRT